MYEVVVKLWLDSIPIFVLDLSTKAFVFVDQSESLLPRSQACFP